MLQFKQSMQICEKSDGGVVWHGRPRPRVLGRWQPFETKSALGDRAKRGHPTGPQVLDQLLLEFHRAKPVQSEVEALSDPETGSAPRFFAFGWRSGLSAA